MPNYSNVGDAVRPKLTRLAFPMAESLHTCSPPPKIRHAVIRAALIFLPFFAAGSTHTASWGSPSSRPDVMSLVNPVLSPGLLAEMTSKPLIFGEVVRQRSLANTAGTREVLPGPPSPQRHLAPHPSRPRAGDEQTAPSSSRLVTPPKRSLQNGPPTPSSERKGKSPIKPLYPADIDLSWPSPFASLRRPAAGLYNPSMACYANATLQVLLHTPPVVRIIHGHDPPNCECEL